jgi:very-short-patch-repair endonuclease
MITTSPLSRLANARLPLPQGERVKEENVAATNTQPSPLAGEGGALAPGEWADRPRTDVTARTLRFAKKLRTEMTDAETKLWQELRTHRFENYKFKRQQPIGKYIADFVCLKHRLIIEVDGSQHEGSTHDDVRDAWLRSQNFRILRFWNIGVLKDMDGALLTILAALKENNL